MDRKENKLVIITTNVTILHRICLEIQKRCEEEVKTEMMSFADAFLVNGNVYFSSNWFLLYKLISENRFEKGVKIILWFTHFDYLFSPNISIEMLKNTILYCDKVIAQSKYWYKWLENIEFLLLK